MTTYWVIGGFGMETNWIDTKSITVWWLLFAVHSTCLVPLGHVSCHLESVIFFLYTKSNFKSVGCNIALHNFKIVSQYSSRQIFILHRFVFFYKETRWVWKIIEWEKYSQVQYVESNKSVIFICWSGKSDLIIFNF